MLQEKWFLLLKENHSFKLFCITVLLCVRVLELEMWGGWGVGGVVGGDGYCAGKGGIHTVTSDALHTHLLTKYKYKYNYQCKYNYEYKCNKFLSF